MIQYFVLTILFFTSSLVIAQETTYYDSNWNKTRKGKNVAYYKIITPEDTSVPTFREETFYASGQMESSFTFRDREKRILEGKYREWDETGTLRKEIEYQDDKKHGQLLTFWPNGTQRRIETYESGKLVEGKCFNENGTEIPHYEFRKTGSFPGGEKALAQYLKDNIIYPTNAKKIGIQGVVRVKFIIGTDGSLSRYEINTPSNLELEREALRVVSKMPNWNPSTEDGEPIRTSYILPVRFSLR